MLKIYWSPLSTPANKVRMCANLLGIEYESVTVDLRGGEQKKPEYLEISPFGKVPAIDDDGYRLFESNAIVKYLCRREDSPLYPTALQAQGRVDAWCDFAASMLTPAMGRIFFNKILAPMLGMESNQESLNDGLRFVGNYLPVLEKQLASQANLASDALTIADLAVLNGFDLSEICEVDISAAPRLCEWRAELRSQDFYQSVHTHFGAGILV